MIIKSAILLFFLVLDSTLVRALHEHLVEQVKSPYVEKRDLGQYAHSSSNNQYGRHTSDRQTIPCSTCNYRANSHRSSSSGYYTDNSYPSNLHNSAQTMKSSRYRSMTNNPGSQGFKSQFEMFGFGGGGSYHFQNNPGQWQHNFPISSSNKKEFKEERKFVNGQQVYGMHHERQFKDGDLVHEDFSEKDKSDFAPLSMPNNIKQYDYSNQGSNLLTNSAKEHSRYQSFTDEFGYGGKTSTTNQQHNTMGGNQLNSNMMPRPGYFIPTYGGLGGTHRTEFKTQTKYVNGKPVFVRKEERKYKNGQLVHNNTEENGSDVLHHIDSFINPITQSKQIKTSRHESNSFNTNLINTPIQSHTGVNTRVDYRNHESNVNLINPHRTNQIDVPVRKINQDHSFISQQNNHPSRQNVITSENNFNSQSVVSQNNYPVRPDPLKRTRPHNIRPVLIDNEGKGVQPQILTGITGIDNNVARTNWINSNQENQRKYSASFNNNNNNNRENFMNTNNNRQEIIFDTTQNMVITPLPQVSRNLASDRSPNTTTTVVLDEQSREQVDDQRYDINPLDGYKQTKVTTEHPNSSRPTEKSYPNNFSDETSKLDSTNLFNSNNHYHNAYNQINTRNTTVLENNVNSIRPIQESQNTINNNYHSSNQRPQTVVNPSQGFPQQIGNKVIHTSSHISDSSRTHVIPVTHQYKKVIRKEKKFLNGKEVKNINHEQVFKNGELIHENKTEFNPNKFTGGDVHHIANNNDHAHVSNLEYIPGNIRSHSYHREQKQEFKNDQKVYDLNSEQIYEDGNLVHQNKTEWHPPNVHGSTNIHIQEMQEMNKPITQNQHLNKTHLQITQTNPNLYQERIPSRERINYNNNNPQGISSTYQTGSSQHTSSSGCLKCVYGSSGNIISTGGITDHQVSHDALVSGGAGHVNTFTKEEKSNFQEHYVNGELVSGVNEEKKWENGELVHHDSKIYSSPETNSINPANLMTMEQVCDNNPCLNDGACLPNGMGFMCLCKFGFKGKRCESAYCPKKYCLYGGICRSEGDFHYCNCPMYHYGGRCENKVPVGKK